MRVCLWLADARYAGILLLENYLRMFPINLMTIHRVIESLEATEATTFNFPMGVVEQQSTETRKR